MQFMPQRVSLGSFSALRLKTLLT